MTVPFIHLSGCGHTGSSIIARVLGEHSQIHFLPFESGMFLANRYYEGATLRQKYVNEAKQRGSSFVLEKTPRHIWHFDYIRRRHNDSRFIVTTRDGREVIASLYERTENFGESCARYFDDSIMSLRQLGMPDTRLIRLEDFTFAPATHLTGIFEWLGLPNEEDVLNFHQRPLRWNLPALNDHENVPNAHDIKRNEQVNSEIEVHQPKWKERLPKELHPKIHNLFSANGIGSQIMKSFGYEI